MSRFNVIKASDEVKSDKSVNTLTSSTQGIDILGASTISTHYQPSSYVDLVKDQEQQYNTTSSPVLKDVKNLNKMFYKDLLPYNQDDGETKDFLESVFWILVDYVQRENDRTCKILEFKQPLELDKIIDFSIKDEPKNLKYILDMCALTLKYQVKTGHPRFFNQLSTGLDIISLAGEWLTATANSNMFTYEISPVFVLMEQYVVKKMVEIIGLSDGDGIFAPGGTISNLYAILCARFHLDPNIKLHGNAASPKKFVIFTSQHSHYSIKGAASITGIGTRNLILVDCDEKGRMLVKDLKQKIEESLAAGCTPLMVNATSGTTVYGAMDPLIPIGNICKKYAIWFHVDAAWGGGALLSHTHRHLLDGIEKADSVTWNPHKLMGALLQCSAFLTSHKDLLIHCNQMCADYLYQQDKPYDVSYDTGDKAIQCGRHVDIFKLWIMWQAKGMKGYEEQIDRLWNLTSYFVDLIKNREGFELIVTEPECTNICFWYIPPSLRRLPICPERDEMLGKVAPIIKGRMMAQGTMMIGYQPLGHKVNFFRLIISNPAIKELDLDFVVKEIERLGHDISF